MAVDEAGFVRVVCQKGETITRLAGLSDGVDLSFRVYRMEVAPPDQRSIDATRERLVQLRFHDRDRDTEFVAYGEPFLIKLIAGETTEALIVRLREGIGIPASIPIEILTLGRPFTKLRQSEIPYAIFTTDFQVVKIFRPKQRFSSDIGRELRIAGDSNRMQ
jgi:hypothetical protein